MLNHSKGVKRDISEMWSTEPCLNCRALSYVELGEVVLKVLIRTLDIALDTLVFEMVLQG